jgi:hypothetical protein
MSYHLTRIKKKILWEKDKVIIDFVKMQNHFFPDLIDDLSKIKIQEKKNT